MGLKTKQTPLLQNRFPVGSGPSSKIWPWCPPHFLQWYSVLGDPIKLSIFVSNTLGIASKKDGQPLPLSYFLPDSKSFKVVKDLFEQVINKKVNGQFEFPDLVVNYNPKLEKQGANFIIRLENKDSIRVGRHYKGILSGTAEFKFNYSNLGDTIKSTDDVRNWLRQEGVIKIDPNPPLKESPATKFTPGSTEPVETVEETMNRIMKDRWTTY